MAAPAFQVSHAPQAPRSGQTVEITVRGGATNFAGETPSLLYQVVAPGRYLELASAGYTNEWVSLPMRGGTAWTAPPDSAGEALFKVEIPASLQKHRHLVRYRIRVGNRLVAPQPGDAQPNFAYFIYDGVPAWRGAIEPRSSDASRKTPVTFSPALMGSVQVYHFIADQRAVENTTWYEPTHVGDDLERHRYRYTGTLVVDGQVYDHVRFRARGGEWRHAMGKNMWKFDFLRGHHLQARDDFGQAYRAKWEKLNLGACIQQANYQCRGEHGLFEAVTFRLFNLAGVPAPHTHYVHLRIIDGAEENPANQYEGDFWGLYLATEELDGQFLKQHGLADGNVYKWDFGTPKSEHLAEEGAKNGEDIRQFVTAYRRPQPESWWRTNVDLARYFSYRSIVECVHHYDIGAGKNYFYYYEPLRQAQGRPPQRRWVVLPWDVDLTWNEDMFGNGAEPFLRAGLLRQPALKLEYENRLREIRDLLFNPEQTGALIDEYAAVISRKPSFVDADRAKWDYHPIMSSRWVHPRKTAPGLFYASSPSKDFSGMLRIMKDFVAARGQWCDATLLADPAIPSTPVIKAARPLDFQSAALPFTATVAAPLAVSLQWRLAEVTPPGASTPKSGPNRYEIQPLWEATGTTSMEVPTKLLARGRTYRVRARACADDGRCGHWSAPLTFQVP
jgi:hypothetical protein